jgi:hypothetical protein
MLRQLAFAASFILLTPSLASAQTAKFQIEETTIEVIQAAIMRGELTSTRVVQLYLSRIKAYNGTCVNQPDGVLGAGPITPIKDAHQLNALMTLNLRPAKRERLGFDPQKARSMTDPVDADPAMPDALEMAAQQDAYYVSTGRLIGALHGVVFSIKDQYDTFDMRTTAGMDAAYANDRPPRDATFVKRLREAGAIILAKANLGEMGTPNSRSSFGTESRHLQRRLRSIGCRESGDVLHRRGNRGFHTSSCQEQQSCGTRTDAGAGQPRWNDWRGPEYSRGAAVPHRQGRRPRARGHRRLRSKG